MAIIYSYPETTQILLTDMLIGTSTIRVAGKKKNLTKNFTIETLGGFIHDNFPTQWGGIIGALSNQTDLQEALDGKQSNITLTTIGTSGPSTFIDSILNIPNYTGGIPTKTSDLINDGEDGIHPFITAEDIPPSASTLNDVLTNGNTSLLDANIGGLGLYDLEGSAYSTLTTFDHGFTFKDYIGETSISFEQGNLNIYKTNSISGSLSTNLLTVSRGYYLPDAAGTIALTSDLTPYLLSTIAASTYYPIPTGTISQYIRGDGTFATFPTIPTFTPSAMTKVDDTNVTLILGGTPATALLQGVSLTLGWTGTLADSRISSATNWNTAYNNRITSLTTTGSGTATLISNVLNIPTPPAATFTSLTTTGSSGSSTLIAGVLNVPTYTLSGLGGVSTSRTLTINGTTYDLTTDRTWSVGTVTSVTATSPITSSGGTTPVISTSMATNKLIGRSTVGTGVMEEITVGTGLTLSAGTLSATSTGGSIPHATASGTDTYTATISGITSYTDGEAFLIRFPNGNTTGCTLNINALGAVPLYRNNDGQLIGGDIWDGGEMLCTYNSTLNVFQCIGTSPNSLFAYVTNADSVAITKGQPVYAFGGTGDRMTVKRAFNTSDAGSAKTVGVVVTSSIAVNQKGIIIVQGLLDGLSILPTATWADGDTVYLGDTAGSITNIKPYAPNHLVYLGTVTTASNGSAGRWYVRVQNGYELDELHNVQAQSPTLKDTLWYDNTVSPAQWKTASISTILGYTPISGTGTTNYLPKFTGASALGNSLISESTNLININSASVLLDNNRFLRGKFVDGTVKDIIGIDIANEIVIGNVSALHFTNIPNIYIDGTAVPTFNLSNSAGALGQLILESGATGNINIRGNGGTRLITLSQNGQMAVSKGTVSLLAQQTIYPYATTIKGQVIKGFTGQTANLQEWQDSIGTVLAAVTAAGNVGIGTTAPVASAKVQIDSTTQGFLPPRMTTAQMNAIASPVTGLTIYNTDLLYDFQYNGISWTQYSKILGVHSLIPLNSGQSTNNAITVQIAVMSGVANRMYFAPYIPAQSITTSSLSINVSTALAASTARILIYENSISTGAPTNKLYESTDLDCSTTGIKTVTTTFNFKAGVTYWMCVQTSGTQGLSSIYQTVLMPLNSSGTSVYTIGYYTYAIGSAPATLSVLPTYLYSAFPLINITKA